MLDMARAAKKNGISRLCFTDHCDIENFDTGLFDPDCFKKDKVFSQFDEALSSAEGIELRLGIELSGASHYPGFAESLILGAQLDFIIGSIHNLRGMTDFYGLKYDNYEFCRSLLDKYVDEYIELAGYGLFDVLGHIGYPLRYIRRSGIKIDLSFCEDKLEHLFKKLSYAGKGIELNTSGLRDDMKETMPSLSILRLYKSCGGEIITTGSDAHKTDDAGKGIVECLSLLKEAGFDYYCTFRDRKPEFIKI